MATFMDHLNEELVFGEMINRDKTQLWRHLTEVATPNPNKIGKPSVAD